MPDAMTTKQTASLAAATKEMLTRPFDPSGGDVIAFALAERRAKRPAAIATLVAIDGAAPRAPGAQMAVGSDGRYKGSISSGCLERAIVEEACAAMARGSGGIERYGKGSRFVDVNLPCGSGVDILYTVDLPVDVLVRAEAALSARQSCALAYSVDGAHLSKAAATGWADNVFHRLYRPALRIAAAGVGAELVTLSRLASAAGYRMCAISPEAETLDQCVADEKVRLVSAGSAPPLAIDPLTAFVFLFHDREWELTLASAVLASPAFFIGAVGSRRTHALRLEALRAAGHDDALLARIEGPAGLIPRTRDPSALAVSVLAGVIAAQPQ